MTKNIDVFSPFHLGPLQLPNRIVMAPMTRNRAGPGNAPTALNATYYAQRASAGLIVTEATQVSPQGLGYPGTPGIHSAEQIAGWKLVTDAVHAAGGRIFLQLWHVGRISHPSLQPDGALPVAPSAIAPAGQAWTLDGMKPFVTPRALETDEIAGIVEQYRHGAAQRQASRLRRRRSARRQRLSARPVPARQAPTSAPTAMAAARANRARLLVEVMEAVVGEWGGERVGVRLSPTNLAFNDISDSDPAATFSTAVARTQPARPRLSPPGRAWTGRSGRPRAAARCGVLPSAVAHRARRQQGLRPCARQRGTRRRSRRSRVVRDALHRQPRLARTLAPRRAVQSLGPQDVLRRLGGRIYRLS